MRPSSLCLLLFLPLALATSCASTDSRDRHAEPADATPRKASAAIREPYTRYYVVESGNEPLGYLLRYEAIPARVEVERLLPTGSHRIQDLEFREVGFITLSGEVFRHTRPGESESLGHAELVPGLTEFFAAPGPVQLVELSVVDGEAAGGLD